MDTLAPPGPDALASPRRNHYFYGKLLDELHLTMEQDYVNGKRWTLNRLALGSGVLCGLHVSTDGTRVTVAAGVAIDALGREIIVPQAVTIDPWQAAGPCGATTALDHAAQHDVYLALCFCERKADLMPALVTDCDTEDPCAPSTIIEGFKLVVNEGPAPAVSLASDDLCKALNSGTDAAERRQRICEILTDSSPAACATPQGEVCVVLATMTLTANGPVSGLDDVTNRNVLCSNELLFELLLCLRGAKGETGPAGRQGPQGDPGPGLESGLTKIIASSWVHKSTHVIGTNDAFVPINARYGDRTYPYGVGLVIGFDNEVRIAFNPDAPFDHFWDNLPLFEVFWYELKETNYDVHGSFGLLWPTSTFSVVDGRITEATIEAIGSGVPGAGRGLALIPFVESKIPAGLLRVQVRGDFILDANGNAIDAEFPRATFPSGDGKPNTGLGLQGGLFESWFLRNQANASTGLLAGRFVSISDATASTLAFVPGIGMSTAEAIVAEREQLARKRFSSLDQLVGIGGIDQERLKLMKPYLKIK